ncbi:uncharacterized protein A4U43_C10F6930 [Asparagus officinalis]|uniref:Uncharacterized protein n=1 Tax=Asparagus officinalis TaxID=4686 RepID=A0A5P1E2Z9_ASPOF|nr:uncharacterized protein A4U43_C10F6930 [Asparagus officinalis]
MRPKKHLHLDLAPEEATEVPYKRIGAEIHIVETREIEVLVEGKTALDMPIKSVHRQGKEPATEGVPSTQGLGWLSLYHISEIKADKWDHLRMFLM